MITFDVDDLAVTARLENTEPAVFAALSAQVRVYTQYLEQYVERNKLQGQVLRHVTGKLSASIDHDFPVDTDQEIKGRVFSNNTVTYAAIHEFGGVIHIPEIVPVAAQALRFEIGGEVIFAKRVKAHDVVMPERSFLRSSLQELAADFERGLQNAALRAAAAPTDDPIVDVPG